MTLSPGTYIRLRRSADGLTIDDLALMIDSVPAVSHRSRIELIGAIESDAQPVSLSTGLVLGDVLSIDLYVLGELVEAHAGRPAAVPPICRACGCSDDNACPGRCSWAEPDLCSACVFDAEQAPTPAAPMLLHQGGEDAA